MDCAHPPTVAHKPPAGHRLREGPSLALSQTSCRCRLLGLGVLGRILGYDSTHDILFRSGRSCRFVDSSRKKLAVRPSPVRFRPVTFLKRREPEPKPAFPESRSETARLTEQDCSSGRAWECRSVADICETPRNAPSPRRHLVDCLCSYSVEQHRELYLFVA
jgi:hypothetical protein